MRDPLKLALIVVLAVFGLSAAALVVLSRNAAGRAAPLPAADAPDPSRPDPNSLGLVLLPFSMTDQSGATVTNDDLKGSVTILAFTFTRCTLVCPRMTGLLFELQSRIASPRVRFVSISVDPEHDTPDVLARYARTFNASPPRWRFLSGDKAKVYSMLVDGLKFGIRENPPLQQPDGTTVPDIRHPSHFFLIGPAGEVLGFYDSNDDQAVERLRARAERIAAALPA